jgi:ParB-like chromosome segregation protein Spo0J
VKVPIGDIQANPFRNIDRYPINRDKVEKLKDSINRTEFWDNLVARLGPDGKPQIGYGHHRLVALRELYPPDHQVALIVKPLDDEAMLHVMADENMKEWSSTAEVTVETVRAGAKEAGAAA